MPKVLILGAGKIGALISGLLAESGSYEVHLADVSAEQAQSVARLADGVVVGSAIVRASGEEQGVERAAALVRSLRAAIDKA